MTIWQFMAAIDGVIKAKTPKGQQKLSGKERSELFDWIQTLE